MNTDTSTAKKRLAIHDATKNKDKISKWHVFVEGRKRLVYVQEVKRRLLLIGCLYVGHYKVIDYETDLTYIAKHFELTPYQPPAKKQQAVLDAKWSASDIGNTLLRDGDGQFVAWIRLDGDLRLEVSYEPYNIDYPQLKVAIRNLPDAALATLINLLGGWIVAKCNCPGVNITADGRIPYIDTDDDYDDYDDDEDEPNNIRIDALDYTGAKPEVFFTFNGTEMSADLDPGVVNPVVIRGSAVGLTVDVEFSDYKELQDAINELAKVNTKPK